MTETLVIVFERYADRNIYRLWIYQFGRSGLTQAPAEFDT